MKTIQNGVLSLTKNQKNQQKFTVKF